MGLLHSPPTPKALAEDTQSCAYSQSYARLVLLSAAPSQRPPDLTAASSSFSSAPPGLSTAQAQAHLAPKLRGSAWTWAGDPEYVAPAEEATEGGKQLQMSSRGGKPFRAVSYVC